MRPTMTNEERIKELKAAGYKVRVSHLRACEWRDGVDFDDFMTTRQMAEWNERFHSGGPVRPSARGGQTLVSVLAPDSTTTVGQAVCSHKDNYCKSTGLALALIRLEVAMVADEIMLRRAQEIIANIGQAEEMFILTPRGEENWTYLFKARTPERAEQFIRALGRFLAEWHSTLASE